MVKVGTTLLKALIIFFSLAVYQVNVSGIPISIDRIILIMCLPLVGFFALKRLNKISFESFFYTLFIVYAVIISTLNQSDFSSYGNMLIISILFFYVASTIWSKSKISTYDLKSTLYVLTLILFAFTVFTLATFLMTSKPPLYLPFEQSIPFISSKGMHYFEEGGFGLGALTRVALPFARPQDLGMTSAILILLLIPPRAKASRLILLMLFIILVTSASRSAIFPLVLAYSVYSVLKFGWSYFLRQSLYFFTLLVLISFILIAFFGNIFEFFILIIDSISRIGDVFTGTSAENHFSVRSQALELIFENPVQTIFGSGIGSFQEKSGLSSAHSTYLTLFHDIGLVGLMLFFIPLITLTRKAIRYMKVAPEYLAIALYITVSHFLYEVPNLLIFWIMAGILSSQMTYSKMKNDY